MIVSFDERVVYSTFVKPPEPVTNFRTAVSGVRPEHLRKAPPFRDVQDEVARLLRSRTIIGHAIHNDLRALMLRHPKDDIRDTALFPAYRLAQGNGTKPRSLKQLAADLLGWSIQGGEHNPAEDAVAALRLYKLKMSDWERAVSWATKQGRQGGSQVNALHRQVSKWETRGLKEKERSEAKRQKKRVKRGTN